MYFTKTLETRGRRFDETKHAKDTEIQKGDKVVLKQQKTLIKPPYDPKPFRVISYRDTGHCRERGKTS